MQTNEIINELRNIAAALNVLGDLRKVNVLNRAADRLEQLESNRAGRETSMCTTPDFID